MWEPRWEKDGHVWVSVKEKDWLRRAYQYQDCPLDESEDPLEVEACRAWLLYEANPDAIRRQRLKGAARDWRDAQVQGWFSLWQREDHGWVDLLGERVVTDRHLRRLRPGDCILGRAVPTPDGLELLAASSDVLSREEARFLLEAARSLGVLEAWCDRRELVLQPRQAYEHQFRCPLGRRDEVRGLLEGWNFTLEAEHLLVRQVVAGPVDPWDDPILQELEEKCEFLRTRWKNTREVGLSHPHKSAVLHLDVDGETTLHFPAHFKFRQLRRALDCLKPGVFQEDSVFFLSLGRQVIDEEYHEPFEHCLRDTTPLCEVLCLGSLFSLEHMELRLADVEEESSGPTPWFPSREDANRRLRRAFYSRLGKVRLKTDAPVETSVKQLAGLERYDFGKLKVKEAMLAALLTAPHPLSLEELRDILVTAGVRLTHGLQSLRKAWRRDPSIEETEDGRLEVEPNALLLDSWLVGRLAGARSGPGATTESEFKRELEESGRKPELDLEQYLVVWSDSEGRPRWRRLPQGPPLTGSADQLLATLRASDVVLAERAADVVERLGLSCAGRTLLDLGEDWRSVARETLGETVLDPLEAQSRLHRYGLLHGFVIVNAARRERRWVF